MLFDENIAPSCSYCRYATNLGSGEYFCIRRGIMDATAYCGKYRYEPTKREPPAPHMLKNTGYTEKDFAL